MVPDLTGRFKERPHYDIAELEVECEKLVTDFLRAKYERVEWPISTDDLTILVEQHVDSLDLYADLSDEGADVEGVTLFVPGRPPRVRISRVLSATERSENRLRTTITHELGHVRFHRFLFDGKSADLDLFQLVLPPPSLGEPDEKPQKCHQHSILHAGQVDWMEWQAGHACGGFLMPASHLRPVVADYLRRNRVFRELDVATSEAGELIEVVAGTFGVSREASRVRLLKMGHLVESSPSRSIFER